MYLLDTNVCIDYTLGRSPALRERIRERRGVGLLLSTITLAELRAGTRRPGADPEDANRLDLFVSVLDLRTFDEAAAEAYGRLVQRIGVRRNSFDRLIAAHALAMDVTLVTNNARDFADIPALRVENWTS